MMINYRKIASLIALIWAVTGLSAQNVPAQRKVGPQTDNTVLVPSNQLISPAGEQSHLPGRPGGLALARGGKYRLGKDLRCLGLVRLDERSGGRSLGYPEGGSCFHGPDGSQA